MEDYRRIMMQEQAEARQLYDYDPRQTLQAARDYRNTVETFNSTRPSNVGEVNPDDYAEEPQGSRGDPQSVQAAPSTKKMKRYVIIDASQRDWVKQPNPYTSLIFNFGSQSVSPSNPPVYTNNPFVPTFAVEQSNAPIVLPGLPNTGGWTLPAAPLNITYPPYNSSLPKGNFIGFDSGYTIQPSGAGFGSVFTPCNVSSLRLVRAVLPQRQFLQVPIVPGDADSDVIQKNLVGKPYSTFTTYPYLLFYLNEYFGQYVGGNEPMRRSFSVMTQKQRQQTNFQSDMGVQQYDYEPWAEEALRLQAPITNLQRLAITVTDPVGSAFAQNDTMSVSLIQATSNGMYLKCFTGSYQYFSSNELRVGDRIIFYPNAIADMMKAPLLGFLDGDKKSFINALSNATFPVLQLLDYVPNAAGVYEPRQNDTLRTSAYVSSYNGFLIPNFVQIDATGSASPLYPGATEEGEPFTVLEPNQLIGSNLPLLNVSLQPVYTLELETVEPDTDSIGGTIVL